MEEDVKITEMTVEEPQSESTERQELEAKLDAILPEEEGSVYKKALAYIERNEEMNDRLVKALSDDPKMAQVFVEVMDGGKSGSALVRHFGKSYLEAEEGSPEYEEIMAADREYEESRAKIKASQEAFDNESNAFYEAFSDYCKRKSLNEEVYLVKIEDKVVLPLFRMMASDELFDSLVKAVDYDKDVEDAFEAGEIKARNMSINEMRAKPGDGMPKGLSSQAQMQMQQPKRKINSLIAKALQV